MQWLELLRQLLPVNAHPFREQRYLEEMAGEERGMVWEEGQFRFGDLGKGGWSQRG